MNETIKQFAFLTLALVPTVVTDCSSTDIYK